MRYLLLGIAISLVACIDELDIDLPEATTTQKVIEGFVERDQNNYVFWAQASVTQDVTSDEGLTPLVSSFTFFYNDEHPIQVEAGTILRYPISALHADFGGTPDQASFRLEAEIGGSRYLSETQQIQAVPSADSLSIETSERPEINSVGNTVMRDYVSLFVHSPFENDQGELTSLFWTTEGAFEFVESPRESDPFYEPRVCYVGHRAFNNAMSVVNERELSVARRVSGYELIETSLDFRFSILYYFTVVQKSLNPSSVRYWQQVKASNERSGTIYDVFPGQIESNIQNIDTPDEVVSGFFHVSAVDTIRLQIHPRDVDFPRRYCASWEEPERIDPESNDPCLNCLKLGFTSSLLRPHYWRR